MFSFILLLLAVTSTFHQATLSKCTEYTACGQCVLSPGCFWCENLQSETKCLQYDNSQLAQFFCPNNWIHDYKQCPTTDTVQIGKNDKLVQMLDLLHQLKMQQVSSPLSHVDSPLPEKDDLVKTEDSITLPTVEKKQETAESSSTTSSADLKELLHKLLLLKLLRKVKNEGSATLTEEDKLLLKELDLKTTTTTTTTTTTAKPNTDSNINNELSQLIEILKGEAEEKSKKVNNEISNEIKLHSTVPTFNKTIIMKAKVPVEKQSVAVTNSTGLLSTKLNQKMTLSNHIESGGVDYQELESEHLGSIGKQHLKNVTTTSKETGSYCHLYLDTILCKNDHNCTWCNSADECIQRNDKAFDICAHTKHYDIDPCFSSKHCKQCVQDDKCYWCDVSKSCHTYPFFGYVPEACGGDWYVKQCDVQLAVIVIVLPLIMILLAMVTFYFCLKYCYYRRKILRVPLFEKPGVFDYRKDKKVYFVHPDDESSENELESERFRKKYRLPADRAPLIDPNS